MIEAGVEISLFFVGSFNVDATQVTVPVFFGCEAYLVEIPSGEFCAQVCVRSFYTGCRKGYLHQQFVAVVHLEAGDDTFPFFCFRHRQFKMFGYGAVEL